MHSDQYVPSRFRNRGNTSLTAVNALTLHLLITDTPGAYKLLALTMAALIWARHRGNLREIARAAAERKRSSTSSH